ncbi:hypothetical protein V6N13_037792 [Hibiscus sabdariffa]
MAEAESQVLRRRQIGFPVFIDNNKSVAANKGAVNRADVDGLVKRGAVLLNSLKDSRTYKEALVGKNPSRLGVQQSQCREICEDDDDDVVNPKAISVRVEEFPSCLNAMRKNDAVRIPILVSFSPLITSSGLEEHPMQLSTVPSGIGVHAINASIPLDHVDQSINGSVADLLDVPINVVGSSDIVAISGFSSESGPTYGAKARAAESLLVGAKLLNIPVGVFSPNASLVAPTKPRVVEGSGEISTPNTHNRVKRGRSKSGGAGCDRFNWWVAPPLGRTKAIKKMRKCSKKASLGLGSNSNLLVGNIDRVHSIHTSPDFLSESESEASKTLGLSKLLRVNFKAPDGVVLSRLADLDKCEDDSS